MQWVAEEAAAEATAEAAAVGQAGNEDGSGDEDLDLPLAPQPEPTRLTGRRHCARTQGEPFVRAFGHE